MTRWGRLPVFLLLSGLIAGLPDTPPARGQGPTPGPGAAPSAAGAADLGVVGPGEAASHAFEVRADGPRPLHLSIRRVAPGLKVEAYDAVIAPGGTGQVRVSVDTWAIVGPATLSVVVATDDPAQPERLLTLRVEVRPFVVAAPGQARFVFVRHIRDGTIAQTVWASDARDFRVTAVEAPRPFFRTAVREARPEERVPGGGSQWRIELTLPADAPVGPLGGALVIRVDHPRQKALYVPVSGFVRPLFAVTPPVAGLGEFDPAHPPALWLHFKSFAEESVAVLGAVTDLPGVHAEVSPLEAGRTYRIRLTVDPGRAPGPFNGTLRIATGNPREPTVEVPIRGTVRTPAGGG